MSITAIINTLKELEHVILIIGIKRADGVKERYYAF